MFIEIFGNQKKNETLQCYHESDNDFDLFAIKTCPDAEFHPQLVGHLPLEISRFTKFLLDRGATITATLSSTHYRRVPLVQGGLEIPCVVKAKLIPAYNGPSVAIRPSVCAFVALFLYTLKRLSSSFLHRDDVF